MFRVLPKIDVARSIIMMNAVCTIPALLKLFLSKTQTSVLKRLIVFILVRSEVLLLIVPWRSIDETAVEVLSPLIWMTVHSVEAHAFKF